MNLISRTSKPADSGQKPPTLYEGRKQIYPKLAHGKFR